MQLGSLRDALSEAGASDEMARKAGEEIASHNICLSGVDTRLTLLTWMEGMGIAFLVPGTWLLLGIAAKVGAL